MRKHCQYTRTLKTYRQHPFPPHPFPSHHLPSSVGSSSLVDTLSVGLSPGCRSTCCTPALGRDQQEDGNSRPVSPAQLAQGEPRLSGIFFQTGKSAILSLSSPMGLASGHLLSIQPFIAAAHLSFALSHITPTVLPYLFHELLSTKQVILDTLDRSSHLE